MKSAVGPQTAVISRDAGSESTHPASRRSLAHSDLCSTEILGESPHITLPSCVSNVCPGLLNIIFFFFNEVWFLLSRYVNSQNNHYWAADNPHVHLEAPLHPKKINIWCDLSGIKIIGPFFFTTTITGEVYSNIIEQFVVLLEETVHYFWFQRDNACSHVTRDTMAVLKSFFNDHLISSGLWLLSSQT